MFVADGGVSSLPAGGGSVVVAGMISISISPDVVDEVLVQPSQSFPFQVAGIMVNGNIIDLSGLVPLEMSNQQFSDVENGVYFHEQ